MSRAAKAERIVAFDARHRTRLDVRTTPAADL
jgi:hypothetical protein